MNKLLLAVLFLAITGCASLNEEEAQIEKEFNSIRRAYAKHNKISDIKDLKYEQGLGVAAFNACKDCVPEDQIKTEPDQVVYTSMTLLNETDPAMNQFLGNPDMKEFGYCSFGVGNCERYRKVVILSPGASSEKSSGTSSSVNSLMIIIGIVLVFVA